MPDRGAKLYEYDGKSWGWENCEVEGCENQVCINLSDKFCFPHSPGNEHIKRMKISAKRGDSIEALGLQELAKHE